MSLGFSVYFGLDNSIEENIKLLLDAKKMGFSRIFTSLHVPEADYKILRYEVKEFFRIAKDYQMDIISDVSPNTFKFLNIENMNLKELKNLGVKTLRIDFGYSEEEIVKMSKNTYGIKLQLNASTVTEEFLIKLDRMGMNYDNVDALHNFYPREGTGISEECMVEKNFILSNRGIEVGAFIESNNRKRSPLKNGLPTLEEHRGKEVRNCANHLFALGNTSVFIGDSLPSYEELKNLSQLRQDAIELRIKLKVYDKIIEELLKQVYSSRIDEARDVIRAAESRLILDKNKVKPLNTVDKNIGDIVIDNVDYGRYMGELQIIKVNQKADIRTNVVASILQEDIHLLKYIKGGKKFYFSIVN